MEMKVNGSVCVGVVLNVIWHTQRLRCRTIIILVGRIIIFPRSNCWV